MAGIYVIGEVTADGHLANISAEVATLARNVAAESDQELSGIVVAADPQPAAGRRACPLPAACPGGHRTGDGGQAVVDGRGRTDRSHRG